MYRGESSRLAGASVRSGGVPSGSRVVHCATSLNAAPVPGALTPRSCPRRAAHGAVNPARSVPLQSRRDAMDHPRPASPSKTGTKANWSDRRNGLAAHTNNEALHSSNSLVGWIQRSSRNQTGLDRSGRSAILPHVPVVSAGLGWPVAPRCGCRGNRASRIDRPARSAARATPGSEGTPEGVPRKQRGATGHPGPAYASQVHVEHGTQERLESRSDQRAACSPSGRRFFE
jgi:hypothetical protein